MGNKYWLLKVTINDISVIHVTAHRCAGGLKKLDIRPTSTPSIFRSVSRCARQSNDTGSTFLRLFQENAPFSRLLRRLLGYGGPILIYSLRVPQRVQASIEACLKYHEPYSVVHETVHKTHVYTYMQQDFCDLRYITYWP